MTISDGEYPITTEKLNLWSMITVIIYVPIGITTKTKMPMELGLCHTKLRTTIFGSSKNADSSSNSKSSYNQSIKFILN